MSGPIPLRRSARRGGSTFRVLLLLQPPPLGLLYTHGRWCRAEHPRGFPLTFSGAAMIIKDFGCSAGSLILTPVSARGHMLRTVPL